MNTKMMMYLSIKIKDHKNMSKKMTIRSNQYQQVIRVPTDLRSRQEDRQIKCVA
jgi:hypothetical protein